jgi:hypothetical protein
MVAILMVQKDLQEALAELHEAFPDVKEHERTAALQEAAARSRARAEHGVVSAREFEAVRAALAPFFATAQPTAHEALKNALKVTTRAQLRGDGTPAEAQPAVALLAAQPRRYRDEVFAEVVEELKAELTARDREQLVRAGVEQLIGEELGAGVAEGRHEGVVNLTANG